MTLPGRNSSTIFRRSLTVFILFIAVSCSSQTLQTTTLTLGGEVFTVEISRTDDERRTGLMNRPSLGESAGMLFVFERDDFLSFWMKNTRIPLSIAYISRDGIIREIHDMEPRSLKAINSQHAVRLALEVNQGTFERVGLSVGDRIEIPPEVWK